MNPLLLLPCVTVLTANPGSATPTAEGILARHVEALGGAARLKAHHSRRISLHMKGIAPFSIPVVVEKMRPDLFRRKASLLGMDQIRTYDGKSAWKIDPFASGKGKPAALRGVELRDLLADVDFDGALVDATAKGHKASYLGVEAVGKAQAHKVRFTFANGNIATVYFDSVTFLDLKWQWTRKEKGQDQVMECLLSDYREVQGVRFAFHVEIGPQGASRKVTMLVDKVEVNPKLEAARFTLPAPKP